MALPTNYLPTADHPLKVLSLFSGIGAFERALQNLGIPFTLVNYCEIDRNAAMAYSILHSVPESLNLKDVTAVDTSLLPPDLDLITYGFPCQDISLAGFLTFLPCMADTEKAALQCYRQQHIGRGVHLL